MLRTLCSAVRMVAFLASFAFIQVIALALVPLTFSNPFLRRVGVLECHLPMNLVMPLLARFVLFASGVWIDVDDQSTGINATRVIYMYNHTSNLDPIIVQAVAASKFIFKKELRYVPLFGWVMYVYKHISIDRKNREQAIESLDRAVRNVVKKNQNVAISPEGTRSKTGELQEFKKGPFHLAIQSKAKIVPVVISGVHRILPPKSLLLRGGNVSVTLLPPINVVGDENVDELRDRIREQFVVALDKASKKGIAKPHFLATALPGLVLVVASCWLFLTPLVRAWV